MKYYILKDKVAVPVNSFEEYAKNPQHTKKVGDTMLEDGTHISTVFLYMDHSWDGGEPLLFETMIFGAGFLDQYQERCSTWEQAEAQHEVAVELAKIKKPT